MGGGSGACFVRLTSWVAQGKVGKGAAALASLALLSLLLSAKWGFGGSALAGNVQASVVARWWGDGVITVLALAR